jgi:uncharacterized protein (DUF302 family)
MCTTEDQAGRHHAGRNDVGEHAGIGKNVHLPFATTVERVEDELKREGFGVLTRIDVRATLREKLGVDIPRFVILGACNPSLAHAALTVEPRVGLLLPCNVVVRETGMRTVRVEAVNAKSLLGFFSEAKLEPIAEEVTARLSRVVNVL